MRLPTPGDFLTGFQRRFSPKFAQQLVSIVDEAARHSEELFRTKFGAGNYAIAQGHFRSQVIKNECRTIQLDGGVVAEARDFNGHQLEGSERVNNFILLVSNDVGMIVHRASKYDLLPNQVPIRQYLASLPFPSNLLFPEYEETVSLKLNALYVARYWFDEDDRTGATIGNVDVVVMNRDCQTIFCKVCDLREYASRVIQDASVYDPRLPLPISLREDVVNLPASPNISQTDDLPIELLEDLGKDGDE
jgi:hypothetical protein